MPSSLWETTLRLLPGLAQFQRYSRQWLRGDVLAGLTVAAYLVPQVMAYATLAGLPPVVGLWATIGPLAVYVFLGSSRQLSVGPESSTALLTAVALAPHAGGDPGRYANLAVTLAVLVGALCLLGWLLRLGLLAELLSKPLLVGYLAGIAVIMIVSQLGTITGIGVDGSTVASQIWSFCASLTTVHLPTLLLGVGVLTALLLVGRLLPTLPGPLIVMLAATALVSLSQLREAGIQVVGTIPVGLPVPGFAGFSVADLTMLLPAAVGIVVVGFSENVLTARAFAGRAGQRINANQELLALGATNLAAAAGKGFPVSCSSSRTALGDALGSRTQLYSAIVLLIVLGTALFAGPVLAGFPTAALGAIVVYAALRLIDVAEFRRLAAFRRSELILALVCTIAVVSLGVLAGVLVAVALSILDLLRRLARPHDGILGYVPGVAGMHDIDDYPDAVEVPGLVIYRYDAPLCFANADDFRTRALDAVDSAPNPPRWLILNAEANVDIDLTAADALTQLKAELADRMVVLALARVKQDLREQLAAAGLVDLIGTDRIFMTLPTAVAAYLRWYKARYGQLPYGISMPVIPPSPIPGE